MRSLHRGFLLGVLGSLAGLVLAPRAAQAAEYFVNASLGNDTFSGAVPGGDFVPAGCAADNNASDCSDGPWASLARVAGQTLVAGDVVHLRCGDIWREPLTIVSSGSDGNPIRFTSYGTLCGATPPVLSGSAPLSSWQPDATQPDVYFTDDLHATTTQLLVDEVRATVAREPNLLPDASPYRTITDDSTEVSATLTARHYLVDTAFSAELGSDPMGAEIHIRNRRWRLQDRIVRGYDPAEGRLRWDDPGRDPHDTELTQCSLAGSCQFPDAKGMCTSILSGFGYYLANLRWMLDAPLEWHQNRVTHRVWIQLPSGEQPSSHNLEASVVDHVIFAENQAHFVVENLDIRNARLDGVRIERSSDFTLQGLRVANSGGTGIYLALGSNPSRAMIRNNAVQSSSTSGIRVQATEATLLDNTVHDTGNLAYANPDELNYLSSGRGNGIAVGGGADLLVERNLIEASAYDGIGVGGSAPGSLLTKNRIDRSCLHFDDGGGIYIGGQPGVRDDMQLVGNMVSRSVGNQHGIPGTSTAAEGIYLDADCEGVVVENNVVWGVAARGVFVHNAYANTIRSNILYGNHIEIGFSENLTAGLNQDGSIHSNVVAENTLFHIDDTPSLWLSSTYDNFEEEFSFGTFENNVYNGLYHDRVIDERYAKDDGRTGGVLTLEGWQALRGQGTGSRMFRPFSFASYRVLSLTSDNLVSNPGFDVDTQGWGCWFTDKQSGDSCTAPNPIMEWSSECGMNGGCLRASGTESTEVLISSKADIAVSVGSSYLAQFLTIADEDFQRGTAIFRKSGESYDALGLSAGYEAGILADYHKFAFDAVESFDAARIDFRVDAGSAMFFDDVLVRGATLAHNDRVGNTGLIVNTAHQALPMDQCEVVMGTVVPGAPYIGLDEDPVDWSGLLEPSEAAIVVISEHAYLDQDSDGVAESTSEPGIADGCPGTPSVQTSNYEGCSHYQLIGEPCTGVVCDTPPESECLNESTFRHFSGVGQCDEANGACEFTYEDIECGLGCTDGECRQDPSAMAPSDDGSCGCSQVGIPSRPGLFLWTW